MAKCKGEGCDYADVAMGKMQLKNLQKGNICGYNRLTGQSYISHGQVHMPL